jgi:hypothetical protein
VTRPTYTYSIIAPDSWDIVSRGSVYGPLTRDKVIQMVAQAMCGCTEAIIRDATGRVVAELSLPSPRRVEVEERMDAEGEGMWQNWEMEV